MTELSWKVFKEDNGHIKDYDIFKNTYWVEVVETLAKETKNKAEFEEAFRIKLMSMYWSRSEYEVVITSWPPYISKEELVKLSYEQDRYYNEYSKFQVRHNVSLTTTRKIDIYEQLQLNWKQFINYVYCEVTKTNG